jgi:Ran GTPase-activating protein (RanGAP) involved in mRNA processing and transport
MTAGSVDISYTWPNLLSSVGSVMNVNSIDRLGTVLEGGQEEEEGEEEEKEEKEEEEEEEEEEEVKDGKEKKKKNK